MVEIEDRGVGLTEEVRQRVERVMAQSQRTIQLASLGEVTQLGLPVVSRLAREHGCEVHLRTSAYGGVRAVVLVPRNLITTMPPSALRPNDFARRRANGPTGPVSGLYRPAGGPTRPAPVPTPTPPPLPSPALAMETGEVRKAPNGLPQRRRESPVPIPVVVTGPTPPPYRSPPSRPPSRA